MSESPRLARAAARVLSERAPLRRPSDAARKRATSAIREALSARARSRRRLRLFVAAGAAAAAAIALVAGASLWRTRAPDVATAPAIQAPIHVEEATGDVVVVRGDVRTPVADHAALAFGEHVVASEGKATLVLGSGTRLVLEGGGEVAVTRDDALEVVHLSSGAVTAKVAKVAPGHRFVVRTPEVDVEVRGTVFRVSRSLDDRCGVTTRVHVEEGLVGVRSASDERSLGPGTEWTSPCEPRAVAREVEIVDGGATPEVHAAGSITRPAPSPERAPAGVRPSSSSTSSGSELAPSELAAQNALFRSAMASKDRGDARRAVADLDVLLTRHPKTPLREAALAQRMKLLATFDRPAATAAARAYLATYPTGFARSDAEALASGAR